MAVDYSVEVCKVLEKRFRETRLHRPMRVERYDAGTELSYDLTGLSGKRADSRARVDLLVEKFVGGGFAGQVYRVKVVRIEGEQLAGIETGQVYAMKILIPPSRGALLFRNLLYWIGFQGPFQLQSNPAAARSGALWQRFIKRAAKLRFGSDDTVNEIHATFIDERLGSCGELSNWVAGRTWRLEVDDRLDLLKLWPAVGNLPAEILGSPEYRAKKRFMKEFVELLGELGAHEFARQYEWSTCKSQPNCLKTISSEADPSAGLIAVDFRAGLALLPFLPMSPGDFKLILKGLLRGSLVQFDRGDIDKLEAFIDAHPDDFAGMEEQLAELKSADRHYRDSIPDVTHNHFRLLHSGALWKTILESARTGWKINGLIDDRHQTSFSHSKFKNVLFYLLALLPFLGKPLCKLWAHAGWRSHYRSILSSFGYLRRAIRGKLVEKAISWHRAGRLNEKAALRLPGSLGRFLIHLPFSILPVGLHKLFTSWSYARARLDYLLLRPVRLYFKVALREQWLRDMVEEGRAKYIVNDEEAGIILSKIKEPFIQKYLKSLAVHVCTLPVTQVVSVIIAALYVLMHPEMPRTQSYAIGLGIIAIFQVTPISPGSLTRGLYVLYLVIRERNFKDYNIAVFLGFFKYIGYLAFPIQMTYRYPELARFMAGHWATESVHIVPVFGERGALLERWVFCLFYNWPLTIGRRMRERFERRKLLRPRHWHLGFWALAAAGVLVLVDHLYYRASGALPSLQDIWWLAVLLPAATGMLITLGAAGASMWRRIILSLVCGMLSAVLATLATAILWRQSGQSLPLDAFITVGIWRVFVFSIIAPIGAVLTELKIPDPTIKQLYSKPV